jgi:predicted amidohydrolase YtcJ
MYTINGAYASFEEDIKGSITRGKLADMVLLSDDPTQTPPEEIKNIKVEMTIIGGEVVWEA